MKVDVNKIIKNIAREKLGPHGFTQKGQSRLWYFSGNYYLILVEFQPSSWDQGTYLNVGLDFNWYHKDYLAFEFGHRLSDFKSPQNQDQFSSEIERLCDLAVERAGEYKNIFTDMKMAGDKLLKLHTDKSNTWEQFHLGVLFGVGGHDEKAVSYLKKVTGDNYKLAWEIERARIARDYIKAIERGDFVSILEEVIQQTIAAKKIS
jgi:hypothetical protein